MKKPLLAALGLLSACPAANAFVITFDNATDYSLFTEGSISGGTNGSHSTADGVGTPNGALSIVTSTDQFNYNAATFNIGNGSMWTTSAYVNGHALAGSDNTGSSLLGLGFVQDASDNFAISNASVTGLYTRVSNSGAGTYQVQMINKPVDGTDGTVLVSSAAFNLTAGNWYKLTLTVAATAANTFSYNVGFQNFGPDGVDSPSNVVSNLSGSLTNAGIYGDTTTTAGIVSRPFTSPGYVDNFEVTEVVPEPSTALLALLGSTALFRRRR